MFKKCISLRNYNIMTEAFSYCPSINKITKATHFLTGILALTFHAKNPVKLYLWFALVKVQKTSKMCQRQSSSD